MSKQTINRDRDGHYLRQNEPSGDVKACLEATGEDFYDMVSDVSNIMMKYCAKRPRVAAATLIGIGFFLGWKIKPW